MDKSDISIFEKNSCHLMSARETNFSFYHWKSLDVMAKLEIETVLPTMRSTNVLCTENTSWVQYFLWRYGEVIQNENDLF